MIGIKIITDLGVSKLSIYKKHKNQQLDSYYSKRKVVDTSQVLIDSTTGGGKTVFANALAWKLKQHGFTIIYITEKQGNELDNAFQIFPVKSQPQKILMKERGIEELNEEERGDLIKIWHPFTFNIPNTKLPKEMCFFTFSIKGIKEEAFSALLVGTADKETVRTCNRISDQLGNDDSMWDFLNKISVEITKDKKLFSYNPSDLFIPVRMSGNVRTLQTIRDNFTIFREHFMLQPHNFKKNINFLELLNDNKHIHFLTLKYIPQNRLRYFVWLTFLQGIEKALGTGKVKNPICLIFEEIKSILPKSIEVSYQKQLADETIRLLNTIRAKGKGGFTISTTQNYFQTYPSFVDSVTETFLGTISPGDKSKLITTQNFKQVDIELLNSLVPGEFIWWRELTSEIGIKFSIDPPPFAICEQEDDFFSEYNKHYKHSLVDVKDVKNYMEMERKNIEGKMREKLKKLEEDAKVKQKKEKEKKKEVKKEKIIEEEKVRDVKKEEKENKKKMCYELRKKRQPNGKPMSWAQIAVQTKLSYVIAQKYAVETAEKRGDVEFITNNWTS